MSSRQRVERLTATGTSWPASSQRRDWASASVAGRLGQRQDDPGALGDLDEVAGRDVAALGMVPAQQRLDADERSSSRACLGWKCRDSWSSASSARRRSPSSVSRVGRVTWSCRHEEDGAGLELLGRVHGDVGAAQQLVRRRAVVRRDRDADAGLDVEGRRHPRRSCGAAPRARGRPRARRSRGPSTLGSRIANSSPPRRASVSPGAAPRQARRDLAQQVVAVGVTERVVDLLEAVEVDEEHGELGVGALGAASARSRRSLSSARLGSPVSASCMAWGAGAARRARRCGTAPPTARIARRRRSCTSCECRRRWPPRRRVGEVDLVEADRLAAAAEEQRHVDLEGALALVGVVDAVNELGDDLAVERRAGGVRVGGVVADGVAVVRVDDRAAASKIFTRSMPAAGNSSTWRRRSSSSRRPG